MNYKTLILGSAATLMLVGGAQAADLAVASSVDYVKVCSAEGAGFYYFPGTDACVKIGGSIRETMGYNFQKQGVATNYVSAGAHYGSQTEATATFVSKWMSSFGAAVIDFQLNADTANGGGSVLSLDHANAKVGGLIFGYGNTIAESVGDFSDRGTFRNDHKVDYIGWAGSAGGFGFAFGVEDNNAYWNGNVMAAHPGVPVVAAVAGTGNDAPDLAAAITGGMGGLSFTLTGAMANRSALYGTGYGVNFGGTWGKAGGLQLAFNVAWSHDAAQFVGGDDRATQAAGVPVPGDIGNWSSAFISAKAPVGGGADVYATLGWRDGPLGGNTDTTYRGVIGTDITLAQGVTGRFEGYMDQTAGKSVGGLFVQVKAATN